MSPLAAKKSAIYRCPCTVPRPAAWHDASCRAFIPISDGPCQARPRPSRQFLPRYSQDAPIRKFNGLGSRTIITAGFGVSRRSPGKTRKGTHTRCMQPFPQRSRSGCIGVPNWAVIVARALNGEYGPSYHPSLFSACPSRLPHFFPRSHLPVPPSPPAAPPAPPAAPHRSSAPAGSPDSA